MTVKALKGPNLTQTSESDTVYLLSYSAIIRGWVSTVPSLEMNSISKNGFPIVRSNLASLFWENDVPPS